MVFGALRHSYEKEWEEETTLRIVLQSIKQVR